MTDVYITFELEMTTFGKTAEIIQIGAVHDDGQLFECCIVPEKEIAAGASDVNGFTVRDGRLFRRGNLVADALTPAEGLTKFLNWIKDNPSNVNKNVWMVGHGAHKADAPVLLNNMIKHKVATIAEIGRIIAGFCDSQLSFRRFYIELPSVTLLRLFKEFNIREHREHDALVDARDLKNLIVAACRNKGLDMAEFTSRKRRRTVDRINRF